MAKLWNVSNTSLEISTVISRYLPLSMETLEICGKKRWLGLLLLLEF